MAEEPTEPTGKYDIAVGDDWGVLNLRVDPSGRIAESSTAFEVPISGTYDATSGKIAFTTDVGPGEALLSSSYAGYALRESSGRVWAFVGVCEHVEFVKTDSKYSAMRTQNGWIAYASHAEKPSRR